MSDNYITLDCRDGVHNACETCSCKCHNKEYTDTNCKPNPVVYNDPPNIFPVWLRENEIKQIIAHWEKTGMFSSIVDKIRSAMATKEIK